MKASYSVTEIYDLGPFAENCFILADGSTQQAAVIDPGDEAPRIISVLEPLKVKVAHILLTHGHIDHVLAVPEIKAYTQAQVYLPPADRELYEGLTKQCLLYGLPAHQPIKDLNWLAEGESLKIGALTGQVWHTPGHTPGSSCFYFPELKILFGGDLLFYNSMGRTDLWGGDMQAMRLSLQRILQLPDDVQVYPGHGPKTSIGRERQHNPFIKELGL